MIGYLYKVYRNITKVRIVPNLNHNPNPMCVPKKCVYLSIISILNISSTVLSIKYIHVPGIHINIYTYVVTYS